MAFLDQDQESGRGVAFSHDPVSGKRGLCGSFVSQRAAGNDLIDFGREGVTNMDALSGVQREGLRELVEEAELALRDMVRVEFTIEEGSIHPGREGVASRSGMAAVRVAVELTRHPTIELSQEEAVLLVMADHLDQILHPQFEETGLDGNEVMARGLGVSPGAAVGQAYFSSDAALDAYDRGEDIILVMEETSPEDVSAMDVAEGILTTKGGLTSHAAIVARGSGTPAVCGASSLLLSDGWFETGGEVTPVRINEGEVISLDGATGQVYAGSVDTSERVSSLDMDLILEWADTIREGKLGVRANADTVDDAVQARHFGAEGIGLCRTEHQFLGDRLGLIQAVILSSDSEDEAQALDRLAEVQQADFLKLLRVMDGFPVTVRLLDPPLHEFLPRVTELLVEQAKNGLTKADEGLLAAAQKWHEQNPMLGTRGVRLGILRPQLFRMQARALIQAAQQHRQEGGRPLVEIMIPLIINRAELDLVRGWIEEELVQVKQDGEDEPLAVLVGSMIETPRAALCSADIAPGADFFSLGTNDLTQLTLGFSRDDVETRIIGEYLDRSLLEANPFETLDVAGVGQLVDLAVTGARSGNPGIKVGVCGEHAGDPRSIAYFWDAGVDYVSCSPYRVPIARLAAAHAVLESMVDTKPGHQR